MPNKIKYSREQRIQVCDLFSQGRGTGLDGERPRGDYTYKDIERLTGVPRGAAYMIVKGKR